MIWLIAKKDFLLNLLSVRLIIGFVLCLVVIPFTMIVSVDNYLNQVTVSKTEQEIAGKSLEEARVYSAVRPVVVHEPQPMSIFSNGISYNVGSKTPIQLGEVPLFPEDQSLTMDNPLLSVFFSIDFITVVAILLSLLALVFSFDCITREREDGTLKIIFTGKISRISFLLGKINGLLLTLLPVLVFCYGIACLILLLHPSIEFSFQDWLGIIWLFFISVLYMLVFIMLGMFISAAVRQSSTSIVLCLLCWIWFLFLVPNLSAYIAGNIVETPSYSNVKISMDELNATYYKEFNEKNQEIKRTMDPFYSGYYNHNSGTDGYTELSGGSIGMVTHSIRLKTWSEPARIEYADKKWAIRKNYQDKLDQQQKIQQYLSFLSPSEIFVQSADGLCQTNAKSYLKYFQSIRQYREAVTGFFVSNKLFESSRYITIQPLEEFCPDVELMDKDFYQANTNAKYAWENRREIPPLELDELPRYIQASYSLTQGIRDALGRICLLTGFIMLLLLGTIYVFMRYDSR